jgi:hypothetical protein
MGDANPVGVELGANAKDGTIHIQPYGVDTSHDTPPGFTRGY